MGLKIQKEIFMNKTHNIGLKNEKLFKSFFTNNKQARLSLLKSFLPLPEEQSISHVEDLDSILPDEENKNNRVITDLKLTLDNKKFAYVRILMCVDKISKAEALFYWSQNYQAQIQEGDSIYKPLYPTYLLIFCDFDFLDDEPKRFYRSFSMRSDKNPDMELNLDCLTHVKMMFVELPKFKKKDINSLLNVRDGWCYLFRWLEDMKQSDRELFSAKTPEMKKLIDWTKPLVP